MTDTDNIEHILLEHGIKPTANRLLVYDALCKSIHPKSITELECALETIDKSVIFRTLQLFYEHHLVHSVDGAQEGTRYEICHSHHHKEYGHPDEDEHIHFYCEQCHQTFCIEDTPLPQISLPEGFTRRSISIVVKGLCPECTRNQHFAK
ncbi:MAG: transcriptional repressor [Paludibacteraceae bacterium]|nr:transcriptional repressor [Paludibacteraceae bacterium]